MLTLGRKALSVPILQGGMGVGVSLGGPVLLQPASAVEMHPMQATGSRTLPATRQAPITVP